MVVYEQCKHYEMCRKQWEAIQDKFRLDCSCCAECHKCGAPAGYVSAKCPVCTECIERHEVK